LQYQSERPTPRQQPVGESRSVRVLFLADEAPDMSAETASGSTLISAQVLRRMPSDLQVHLAYFDDGRRRLDSEAARRCTGTTRLPVRSVRAGYVSAPFTRLPRATWQRSDSRSVQQLLPLARSADVLYAHGLHSFGTALRLVRKAPLPLVAQEVDWCAKAWDQRAHAANRLQRVYLAQQASRSRRLEQRIGDRAAEYLVVSPDDAVRLSRYLGRSVVAVPNGVDVAHGPSPAAGPDGCVVGFFGSLDYAANVEAVTLLSEQIMPAVRARVPGARLRVGGRRCGPAVERFSSDAVELVGTVADPADFYRSVTVMAYPGLLGVGTKNTVLEALAAGAPVVASTTSARGIAHEGQLLTSDDQVLLVDLIAQVLTDQHLRAELSARGAAWAAGLPSWQSCASNYAQILRAAASSRAAGTLAA
jgi:polysaccharide biosynthesis protein PslH